MLEDGFPAFFEAEELTMFHEGGFFSPVFPQRLIE